MEDWFYPHPASGNGFIIWKQTDYSSYIFNGNSAKSADAETRITQKAFASVRQPSRLILVSEFSGALRLSAHDHTGSQQMNNAKNVVAFIDGHVSYIPIYWDGNSAVENTQFTTIHHLATITFGLRNNQRSVKKPNNSPEPPPIGAMSPHSRLTNMAARLSFCLRAALSVMPIQAPFIFILIGLLCGCAESLHGRSR